MAKKQWPPKFHIKFRNTDPPPYLGFIPKKKTVFLVLPLFHLMHNVSVPPCLTHSKLGDLEDRVEDFSDRLDEFLMDRVN